MIYPFQITEFLGRVPLRTYSCFAHVVANVPAPHGWQLNEVKIAGENGDLTTLPPLHRLYNLAITQISAEGRRVEAAWAARHDEHEPAGEAA